MPTPAQIDEQVQLERDQIRQGLKRLRNNTDALEQKNYASATIYGVSSIDILLPRLVERLERTSDRIHRGTNGVAFKEIAHYIRDLEPLAASAIALKLTFDKVFGYKEGSNQIQSVSDAIGLAVEAECQMRHYERCAPGLLEILKKNYWHKASGTKQRLTSIQTLMNRKDIQRWQSWGRANRIKLGAWLLDCIIEASCTSDSPPWFTKSLRREGKRTLTYVVPTPTFLSIKDKVMADAELFAPLAWPMLIEPNDWTNNKDQPGGYLLNEVMRGHPMVRRGGVGRLQGETPINFLNKIQKVAFTLNPFTVQVAEELERLGREVGKFLPVVQHEMPPKPIDIAENLEARKAYNRAATHVQDLQHQEHAKSCRTRMTMEAVRRFKDVSKFYIPWSFDYRGRAYPIPAYLTPQDTDFGKSLLIFADGSYMTPEAEDWLAFQVATTFGLDKAPMTERLEWARNNHELFTLISQDPIGNLPLWEGVEEPWQFLAAAEEYYHCVVLLSLIHISEPTRPY